MRGSAEAAIRGANGGFCDDHPQRRKERDVPDERLRGAHGLWGATGQRILESFAAVIPFEDGPGVVLPYLVMLGRSPFVQGNLELSYKDDEVWGVDGEDLDPEEKVKARAHALAERIVEQGIAAYVYVDEDMPARYVVCAGYRLAKGITTAEITEALRAIFGEEANG